MMQYISIHIHYLSPTPHSPSEVIRGATTTNNTVAELAMEETEHEKCLAKRFHRSKEHEEK
jgi:hypothetical protein